MTARELILMLRDLDPDKVVILELDGWSNIENVIETLGDIRITCEKYPVFSDN